MIPREIRNVGVVRVIGVQVFENENLTSILEFIDWGFVDPNETKTCEAWILNTGNDDIRLSLWTNSWVPANASDWITLSWDYNDSIVAPKDSIRVEFSLFVDPDIEGIENFSFDIWLMGVKVA